MVERAREEFMFNLRKIMIIFYFMVERTTPCPSPAIPHIYSWSLEPEFPGIPAIFSGRSQEEVSCRRSALVLCVTGQLSGDTNCNCPKLRDNWWATIHYVLATGQQQTRRHRPQFKFWLRRRCVTQWLFVELISLRGFPCWLRWSIDNPVKSWTCICTLSWVGKWPFNRISLK